MNKLYLNYFSPDDNNRKKELDFCTRHNIKNELFDKVYILLDNKDDYVDWLETDKTEIVYLDERPTYRDYFNIANENDENDTHILCNLDIFFDKTLNLVYENIEDDHFLALTRWDVNLTNKSAKFFNVNCSQDTWIWKNKIDLDKVDGDYRLGVGGCDNAICGDFHVADYKVLNPSAVVKTYHLHTEPPRRYNDSLKKDLYFLYPTNNFKDSKIQFWKKGV